MSCLFWAWVLWSLFVSMCTLSSFLKVKVPLDVGFMLLGVISLLGLFYWRLFCARFKSEEKKPQASNWVYYSSIASLLFVGMQFSPFLCLHLGKVTRNGPPWIVHVVWAAVLTLSVPACALGTCPLTAESTGDTAGQVYPNPEELEAVGKVIDDLKAPFLPDRIAKDTLLGEAYRYTLTSLHKLDFYTDSIVCCIAFHVGYKNAAVMTLMLVLSFGLQAFAAWMQVKQNSTFRVIGAIVGFVPEVMEEESAVAFETARFLTENIFQIYFQVQMALQEGHRKESKIILFISITVSVLMAVRGFHWAVIVGNCFRSAKKTEELHGVPDRDTFLPLASGERELVRRPDLGQVGAS